MGTSSANWRGLRDDRHHPASGTLRFEEHTPNYHFGNKNIDMTAATIYRSDIITLHDAAISGPTAFQAAAASVFGSWWTSLLSTCDNAGCADMDDPRVLAQVYYRGPITLT